MGLDDVREGDAAQREWEAAHPKFDFPADFAASVRAAFPDNNGLTINLANGGLDAVRTQLETYRNYQPKEDLREELQSQGRGDVLEKAEQDRVTAARLLEELSRIERGPTS